MPDFNVRVNGEAVAATVKPIRPGHTLDQAKSIVKDQIDGYDTYGVRLADGRDALLLTQSVRDLRKGDKVLVDGRPAEVRWAENEINTAKEVKWTKISAWINGAAAVLNTVAAVESESTLGTVAHGTLAGLSGNQLSHNLSDLSKAQLVPLDAFTDGIAGRSR